MTTPVNPYEAPRARVADVADMTRPNTPRPGVISLAVVLLWAAMAFEALGMALDFDRYASAVGMVALGVTLVLVGFVLWLITLIGKGRNWARLTYLALFVLGSIYHLTHMRELLTHSAFDVVTTLAQTAMQLAAMVLLFLRESNAWFRRD